MPAFGFHWFLFSATVGFVVSIGNCYFHGSCPRFSVLTVPALGIHWFLFSSTVGFAVFGWYLLLSPSVGASVFCFSRFARPPAFVRICLNLG